MTSHFSHSVSKQRKFQGAGELKTHSDLDSQFNKYLTSIRGHLQLLQKQPQIRVKRWLEKMKEETINTVWKRNRNAYARLLLEQLSAGRLTTPFHTLPPDGPLPTLPKHTSYPYQTTPQNSRMRPKSIQQESWQSPSEQLDTYLEQNGLFVPKTPQSGSLKSVEYRKNSMPTLSKEEEYKLKLKAAESLIKRQAAMLAYNEMSNEAYPMPIERKKSSPSAHKLDSKLANPRPNRVQSCTRWQTMQCPAVEFDEHVHTHLKKFRQQTQLLMEKLYGCDHNRLQVLVPENGPASLSTKLIGTVTRHTLKSAAAALKAQRKREQNERTIASVARTWRNQHKDSTISCNKGFCSEMAADLGELRQRLTRSLNDFKAPNQATYISSLPLQEEDIDNEKKGRIDPEYTWQTLDTPVATGLSPLETTPIVEGMAACQSSPLEEHTPKLLADYRMSDLT